MQFRGVRLLRRQDSTLGASVDLGRLRSDIEHPTDRPDRVGREMRELREVFLCLAPGMPERMC